MVQYVAVLRLQLQCNSHWHGTKLSCWKLVPIICKSKNSGSEDEEKEKLMQRMLSCCYWCLGRKSWRVCLGWPLTSYCCLLLHQTCSNRQWNLRWLPLLLPPPSFSPFSLLTGSWALDWGRGEPLHPRKWFSEHSLWNLGKKELH